MEALRPEDPRQLGPYRLRGRLGEGGMGSVFLGVSPGGLRAAVKTIRAEYTHDPGFRDRFRREVDAARRVDSAWTAPIAEADPDSEPPWLATEYLTGLPLAEAVRSYGTLPEPALRILTAQLVEALMAIHRAGLVHRDLKPSNVILGRDRPRVIDFGISRALDVGAHPLTSTGQTVGSPTYMSPEQAMGEVVGPASDVFSLASVLVYAATGHSPFDGPEPLPQMQMLFRVVQTEPRLDDVPGAMRGLLAECLAKRPQDRPTLPEILRRTVGDSDATLVESGRWLPALLAAELTRRHLGEPEPRPQVEGGVEDTTAGLTAATVSVPVGNLSSPMPARPPHPPTVAAFDTRAEVPGPRGGLSRRGFLAAGGVVAVAAVGATTGWLLTRDGGSGGDERWQTGVGRMDAPVVTVDKNLVYVSGDGAGKESAGLAGFLVALDAGSGEEQWRRTGAGHYVGKARVIGDNVFLVARTPKNTSSNDQPYTSTVHAFDAQTGIPRWQQPFASQLVIAADDLCAGNLVLAVGRKSDSDAEPGRIVALDPATGVQKWQSPLPKDTGSPLQPVVTPDGFIVLTAQPAYSSYNSLIRLLDGTGTEKWTFPITEPWVSEPALAGDRVIVRAGVSGGGAAYAVELAGGRQLWRSDGLQKGSGGAPQVFGRNAYITTQGPDDTATASLQALDTITGGQNWRLQADVRRPTAVAFAKDTVYVCAYPSEVQSGAAKATRSPGPTDPPDLSVKRGAVYALNASTGRVLWTHYTGDGVSGGLSAPVVAGGTVCVTVDAFTAAVTASPPAGASAPPVEPAKNAAVLGLDAKSGKQRWTVPLADRWVSVPVAGKDSALHLVAYAPQDAAAADAVVHSVRAE